MKIGRREPMLSISATVLPGRFIRQAKDHQIHLDARDEGTLDDEGRPRY
jgi:hypothetical protein